MIRTNLISICLNLWRKARAMKRYINENPNVLLFLHNVWSDEEWLNDWRAGSPKYRNHMIMNRIYKESKEFIEKYSKEPYEFALNFLIPSRHPILEFDDRDILLDDRDILLNEWENITSFIREYMDTTFKSFWPSSTKYGRWKFSEETGNTHKKIIFRPLRYEQKKKEWLITMFFGIFSTFIISLVVGLIVGKFDLIINFFGKLFS